MSNCVDCTRANPINRCAGTLTIPEISGTPDANYTFIIKDVSTGRTEAFEKVLDDTMAIIDVSTIEFLPGHVYELRAYEGTEINEPRIITIGVTENCCVQFEVEDFGAVGTAERLSLDVCE